MWQKGAIRVPLPPGRWRVAGELAEKTGEAKIAGRELVWRPAGEWCGCAVVLER